MGKKYRGKLHSIYGGSSAAGRERIPLSALNGMTPKQHCEKLVSEASKNSSLKGYFKEESIHEDVCMLPHANYFGGDYLAAVYSYYYDTYEKIELSSETDFKWPANTKRTTIGVGEGITISSNVAVKWEINSPLVKINRQHSHSIHISALDKAGVIVIKARHNYDEKTMILKVVIPNKIEYSLGKYIRNGKTIPMIFHKKGGYELVVGLKMVVHPKNVNFGNISIRELDSPSVDSGIFNTGEVHCHIGGTQPAGSQCNGSSEAAQVADTENLLLAYDIVGGGENNPNKVKTLPSISAMHINIQKQWILGAPNDKTPQENWKNFSPIKQSIILYSNGNITISKGNYSFSVTKNSSFEEDLFMKQKVNII